MYNLLSIDTNTEKDKYDHCVKHEDELMLTDPVKFDADVKLERDEISNVFFLEETVFGNKLIIILQYCST